MNIIYSNKKQLNHNVEIFVLKVDDIELESKNILLKMKDNTWLNRFDNEKIKESYENRAKKTSINFVDDYNKKKSSINKLLSFIGEKIITINSTAVIENEKNYISVPLPDLWKMKIDKNPGFDYYNENNIEYFIVFGEGKYKKNTDPYGDALKQVNRFINEKHDLDEVAELKDFVDVKSINNFDKRIFSIGFSIKSNNKKDFDCLFANIIKNKYLKLITKKFDIIIVGVLI